MKIELKKREKRAKDILSLTLTITLNNIHHFEMKKLRPFLDKCPLSKILIYYNIPCLMSSSSFGPDVVCSVSVIPLQHKSSSVCMSFVRLGPTTGRLLRPRWEIALSVFLKDTGTRYRIGSRNKFRNLSITSQALYHLSLAAIMSYVLYCNINSTRPYCLFAGVIL